MYKGSTAPSVDSEIRPAVRKSGDYRGFSRIPPHGGDSSPYGGSYGQIDLRSQSTSGLRNGSLGNLTRSASVPSGTQFDRSRGRHRLMAVIRDMSPEHRVCQCGRRVVPGRVPTLRVGKDGGAFYAGVRACGSVWACPYCAAKVGSKRAAELRLALESAEASGLRVALVTFTVRHCRGDGLSSLLDRFSSAMRRWRSGRAWQHLAGQMGYVGSVRNLEVTWGEETGWHPHAHGLLFFSGTVPVAELKARWVSVCESVGLEATHERGLDVTMANADVHGYLTKVGVPSWSASEELALSHYKRGRERLTPFDLVRSFRDTGDVLLRRLWREYLEAFKGRRQLYWSRGLRNRLGLVADVGDEGLANEVEDTAEIVYAFTGYEWRSVVKNNMQLALLERFQEGGIEAFIGLLYDLCGYGDPASWNPAVWWDPVGVS